MRRGVSQPVGVLYALLPVVLLGASFAAAEEPVGPVQLSVRVVSVEPTTRFGRGVPSGVAEIEAAVFTREDLSGLTVRVLDSRRQPLETDVIGEGPLLAFRVSLTGARVHELIVEAAATAAEGPVRDEVALRIPLGVAGFAPADDGEIAAFPLEERP